VNGEGGRKVVGEAELFGAKEGVYRKQKGRKEGCGPQAPFC